MENYGIVKIDDYGVVCSGFRGVFGKLKVVDCVKDVYRCIWRIVSGSDRLRSCD